MTDAPPGASPLGLLRGCFRSVTFCVFPRMASSSLCDGTMLRRPSFCSRILPGGRVKQSAFANDTKGHAALLAWADRHAEGNAVHFCMGSTGSYSEAPATHLANAGRFVSVANPARVKYAGLARGRGNKTDRADARLIAEYAARQKPKAWQPPPPEVRELQALVRRIDDLVEMAAREKCRLASAALTKSARQSITRTVRLLEKEVARVREQADALVAARESLSADRALLESVSGIGRQMATTILAELPAVERLPSAESATAYCGLSPREYQSGTSVKKRTRLSKAGNARLRKALFMPTQTAVRFTPVLKRFFERLVGAGKSPMQAIGACMRKLVMICYGVLKNRQPFDPKWSSRSAT
jgi:transposase